MSYISTVLADSPALLWRLNDTSGTTAADDSNGSGTGPNTGTYNGSFTLNQTPATPYGDNAVILGTNVSSAYAPFVSGSARTFEGWAYPTSGPSGSLMRGSTSSTGPDLYFGNTTTLSWYPQNSSAANWSGLSFPLNTWTYWALTWDDTAQTAELFINGVSQGQKTVAQSYNTPGNFDLGGDGFAGHAAGAAVYTSILTATQIQNHYNAASGGGSGGGSATAGDTITFSDAATSGGNSFLATAGDTIAVSSSASGSSTQHTSGSATAGDTITVSSSASASTGHVNPVKASVERFVIRTSGRIRSLFWG